jgi:hypothetical protein
VVNDGNSEARDVLRCLNRLRRYERIKDLDHREGHPEVHRGRLRGGWDFPLQAGIPDLLLAP